MKRLMSITITLLFIFTLVFSAHAVETQVQSNMGGDDHHMPWSWDEDDDDHHHSGNEQHSGNFKIADLTGDDVPEIVLLEDETLTIMNNKGDVLFTEEVEDIEDYHGGWWSMPMFGNHNHAVGLEVSNLDDDDINPEIIIKDAEKLIVLDNEGKFKYTIALP